MKVEIAEFTIPYTYLLGGISLDCILGSNFIAKIATKVGFKVKKLHLHQGYKTSTVLVQEEACSQEKNKNLDNIDRN